MAIFMGERDLPTIPQYYMKYINKDVDLTTDPKQCCPFHSESTPSFSYMSDRDLCTCFGKCHHTWDVIGMHQMNYHLPSYEEAKRSLYALYGIKERVELKDPLKDVILDEEQVELDSAFRTAIILSRGNIDRYLELDYVMSKYPVDVLEIEELVAKWKSGEKE